MNPKRLWRMRSQTSAWLALVVVLMAAVDRTPRPPRDGEEGLQGPDGADAWFLAQRQAPDGVVHVESRLAAVREARDLRASAAMRATRAADVQAWELVGPTNVSGRITDLAGDPGNENLLYVAAASGGVWKTANGGATWSPIFDGQGSLAIGALAIQPGNANVLYVGTGEANPGGGSLAYGGDGIWKTSDGGATWSALGLASSGSVGRIAVDPQRPNRVFVAAMGSLFAPNPDRGLYRSLDGGATWTNVLHLTDSTGCVDVAIDPATPDRVYAATWERTRRAHTRNYGGPSSGIWRSTDGGVNWTRLAGGLPPASANAGRIGIAIAPSQPQRLYAVYSDASGNFAGFFSSLNGGDTWATGSSNPIASDSPYCWWFGRLWVNPQVATQVWFDGILLYRSDDGGATWNDALGSLHLDQHAQWIEPSSPAKQWKGNDGGLYRTTDGGANWAAVTGIPNLQFYTAAVSPRDPLKAYGGAQDHGVFRTPGAANAWQLLFSGDGQYVVIDPTSPSVIYGEFQYGALVRSIDNGATFQSATTGIAVADRKNWSTPVVADPSSAGRPLTRLYYGANRLYRSLNSAANWSPVSPDLTNGDGGSGGVVFGTLTTIAVAPSDSATIYAGTDDGNVWVTSNYAATWQPIAPPPHRWVTRIAVDPTNPAIAYATVSGLRWNDPLPHIFRTGNRGASWTDVSGNLPDAPANDVIVDPRDPALLYVATDVGVFASGAEGTTWSPLGAGLPDGVIVNDLEFVPGTTSYLYAATYGRSMYRLDVTNRVATVPPVAVGPSLRLEGPRPNPWRDATTLAYVLPAAGSVTFDVLDVAGRPVATLEHGWHAAGPGHVTWSGRDARGAAVSPGVYFARLRAGGNEATVRLTRVR